MRNWVQIIEFCERQSATHERLPGFSIEQYAGNFPLRLAPDQGRFITTGAEDDPASGSLVKYTLAIAKELAGWPPHGLYE